MQILRIPLLPKTGGHTVSVSIGEGNTVCKSSDVYEKSGLVVISKSDGAYEYYTRFSNDGIPLSEASTYGYRLCSDWELENRDFLKHDFKAYRYSLSLSTDNIQEIVDSLDSDLGYKNIGTPTLEVKLQRWNVPCRNNNFIGRIQLLEKIKDFFVQETDTSNTLLLVACHGLGGIGKTHLALEYVWQNYQDYNGVYWFNAATRDKLLTEYNKLGLSLKLYRGDENLQISDKSNIVKSWLEDQAHAGWLLVFDNAPNYGGEDGINSWIPSEGGKILITSRYSIGWSQSLSVDSFSREESKAFIKRIFDGKVSDEEEFGDTMANTLGDLALALAQACAYIRKCGIKVSPYLDQYNSRKVNFLNDNTPSKSEGVIAADANRAIVYITWDMTMDTIRKESQLAVNWLRVCSYMANNSVPDFLFEKFAQDKNNNPDKEMYEEARWILSSFSMIAVDEEKQNISIHRLVLEVNRLTLKEVGQEEEIIGKVLKLIEGNVKKEIIDQGILAWDYASSYNALVKRFSHIPSKVVEGLRYCVRYEEALTFGTQALKTLQNVFDLEPNHTSILSLMHNLALVLNCQGKYSDALTMHQEVYEKQILVLRRIDHPDILETQLNMGGTLFNQGENEKALELWKMFMPKDLKI